MPILISGLQNRVKNSAAYAEELGLMLIANGEEMPYLLTAQGERIPAGLTVPTDTPTVADTTTGNLPNGDYVVYKVVYVAESSFPLIAQVVYSNPGPQSAVYHITGTGNRKVTVSFSASTNSLITHVYLFRTDPQTTSDLAQTAADAGDMNFVAKVANTTGTLTIQDNTASVIGNELIQLINFTVPQFRFVVWDGSYYWGFANHPFYANATWETDGAITLNDPSTDKFWGGRDNQYITFDSVHSGGIDNRGTYLFKQTGDYTGKVVLSDGSDTTLPSSVSGNIVITGDTATLYRSGYRNPFQWGYLQSIGGIYVPSLWLLKISGSLGTAIAIIPDQQLLKLDMEFPALCLTFSLQSSSTDVFQQTRRQVSRLHSVTSHFSQFAAIADGRQVLWGMDYKNLAIVQSDGYTQVPISGPISILLRQLSRDRNLHLICHGIYDPTTECNCIWLSSNKTESNPLPFKFDICIYQHAPTGYWGMFSDYGILASAPIEDPITSERSILVGTENGFLGKAFDETTYGNFLPTNSLLSGSIWKATSTTITRAEGQDDFSPTDAGLVGNYCVIVDPQGLNPQVVKITATTNDTLTFGTPLQPIPFSSVDSGLVEPQWKFFIGLIELRMLKYFNDSSPALDKAPREYWSTLEDANNPQIEFYSEHETVPQMAAFLKQDSTLDSWFTKLDFPTGKKHSYGLALVERSYSPTKFFDFTLK